MVLSKRLFGPVLALFVTVALVGCGSGSNTTAPTAGGSPSAVTKGGTLTIAFSQEPDTLNPAQTGLFASGQIDRNVFDTLTWITAQGKIVPDLATGWKVSPDGKTYTFTLRKGVKFTDGTAFNAAAVKFNLDYILKKSTHSIFAISDLGPYKSSTVLGPYKVAVNLTTPDASLLTQLATPYLGMQSPTAVRNTPAGKYSLKPVGSGPFEISKFVPNSEVVLKRNPNYNWAPSAEKPHGAAYLSKIVFQIMETGQTRVDALQSDQAQVVDVTPPLYYQKPASNVKQLDVIMSGSGMEAIFDTQRPPTNDVKVRQALIYFMDREGMIKLADEGAYKQTWGPLQPATIGYDSSLNGIYAFSPSKGSALLQSDGWTKSNGKWMKGGKQLAVIISVPTGVLDIPTLAQAMQSYLQKQGVKASIIQADDSAWHALNVQGAANITWAAFPAIDPDLLRLEFSPAQYFDWGKYNNPKITNLLNEALVEQDPSKRLQMYDQIQKVVMDDAVVIPIHQYADLMLVDKSVHGLQPYQGGDVLYYSAWKK